MNEADADAIVPAPEPLCYRFAGSRYDTGNGVLHRGNRATELRAKTGAVLTHLLANAHRTVSRDELMQACWADTVVGDDTLVQSIVEIRRALGDNPREPRFIKTVHGMGYRFVAPIEAGEPAPARAIVVRQGSRIHVGLGLVLFSAVAAATTLLPQTSRDPGAEVAAVSPARVDGAVTASRSEVAGAQRLFELALRAAEGYRTDEAERLLKAAVERDPGFAAAYARLGYTYAVLWGRVDEAGAPLRRAAAAADRLTRKERAFVQGWLRIADRDFDGAITTFQRLTTAFPVESEAFITLGKLLSGEERFDEAIVVMRQALAISPNDPWVHNTLGNLFLWTYEREPALQHHRRYVELDPDNPNAHDSLALSLAWFGERDRAESEFRLALTLDPGFGLARKHLAALLFHGGRYAAARTEYEAYFADAPSDLEKHVALERLALIAAAQGDLEAAAELMDRADRRAPGGLARVQILLERGDAAAAAREYEARLGAFPWSERGRRAVTRHRFVLMGQLAIARGDVEEGLTHIRAGLARRPLVWEVWLFEDALGRAYLELGRFDEAVAEFERILKFNPEYPLAHYHLGEALDGRGQSPAARAAYERFLEVWSDADAGLEPLRTARARVASP